jgi:HSP20 family protein
MNGLAVFNRRWDRLFDDLASRHFVRPLGSDWARGNWSPAINVLEKTHAIEITADMPGLRAEDVEVTVQDGVLTLTGERKFEEASEGETYHRVERGYGRFERTFNLPDTVDTDKIEARFKDGEMLVVLPKREETKPRKVNVKVESN